MNPVSTRSQRFITNHVPENDDHRKREEAITLSIQEEKKFHTSLSLTIGKLELREKNLQKEISKTQLNLNKWSATLKELAKSNDEFYAEMKALDQRFATPVSLSITPPFVKRIFRLFEEIFCLKKTA